jgi:hypothetical protein
VNLLLVPAMSLGSGNRYLQAFFSVLLIGPFDQPGLRLAAASHSFCSALISRLMLVFCSLSLLSAHFSR